MATDVTLTPPPTDPRVVALLVAEPDLADGIPPDDLEFARRVLVMPRLRLERGPWNPQPSDNGRAELGFFVLEGALAHEVLLAGDRTMQLLGPGDVVEPFGVHEAGPPARHLWQALEDTTLGAIDHRFVAATRRWPSLGVALHRRLAAQAARASVHTALAQLGRVELRVLAALWQLVDRWGVVTPDGVAIQLRLTHEAIGRLVGARRPTVTLALKDLGAAGLVGRREDGTLVLAPESREVLAP
jgi:CRP/FNR family transcriptional regulator, cyclic AMP receptor protein